MKKLILRVEEMAQSLNLKPSAISRKANEGAFPAVKIGRKWVFSSDIIQDRVKQKALESIEEYMRARNISKIHPI